MDACYVAVGGGGLISGKLLAAVLCRPGLHLLTWLCIAGCASVLKSFQPHVRVIGCQPEASNVMQQSVAAGKVVEAESLDTLSDGTAGMLSARCRTRVLKMQLMWAACRWH